MWQVVLYITAKTVVLFVSVMLALSWASAWWYHRDCERAARVAKVLLVAWGILILMATLVPTQPLGTSGHDISWVPGEGMWGDDLGGLFPEEPWVQESP
jgi:hypothetical protein